MTHLGVKCRGQDSNLHGRPCQGTVVPLTPGRADTLPNYRTHCLTQLPFRGSASAISPPRLKHTAVVVVSGFLSLPEGGIILSVSPLFRRLRLWRIRTLKHSLLVILHAPFKRVFLLLLHPSAPGETRTLMPVIAPDGISPTFGSRFYLPQATDFSGPLCIPFPPQGHS